LSIGGIVPIGFVWKEKVITFNLAEWRRGLGMLGWIVGGAAVSVFEGGVRGAPMLSFSTLT